ncbi:MAG TPA: nucleotidyltransferase family protein [Thermoanaerobaculia bacterium]
MDRADLIPQEHRRERLLLLELLSGKDVPFDVDPAAFLTIASKKLHPFLFLRLNGASLPAVVRDTLSAAYRHGVMRELRRGVELRRIDKALTAAGVRFLVLKGPVLAASVYPDRASRTMTDLDFLVAAEDLPRATSAMRTAGYSVPDRFIGVSLPAGEEPPLIHDDPGGPSIELHTMLDSLPNERDALAAMWPQARRVDVGHGLTLPALERGEFFAHVAVHMSKHHRFEGELRSLLDVALLLRSEPLDWDALIPEWERRGLAEWIVLTGTLAHVLLGAPLPRAFADRRPPDSALAIAAELLWVHDTAAVPQRVTYALAGNVPVPVHDHVAGRTVTPPRGVRGIPVRVARQVDRLQRVLGAAIRPRAIASAVALHRKRERLFGIVEKRSVHD